MSFRVALTIARVLPSHVAHYLALFAGSVAAWIGRERRAMYERHLRRVRPDHLDDMVRKSSHDAFRAYARYYVESFRLPRLSRQRVERGFSVEGFEHIEEGIAAGRGVILALPHLGGWEWAGRWLADRGYDVHAVAEVLGNEQVTNIFIELRARLGMTVIPLDEQAGVKVASALRSNAVVCLLCDRDIKRDGKRSGVSVEFFGESTSVPSGPAFFSLRTGAALLPVATYFRRDVDGHHAVVGPPLEVEPSGKLREDVARLTQRLVLRVEDLIREAPEQWHLFQPNWPSDPGY
jgi:KDO2-lipid IV(A) lauroyltransferase